MIALSDRPSARGSTSARYPVMVPALLEPLEALGHGRRRQPDPASQLGERQPRVLLELGK